MGSYRLETIGDGYCYSNQSCTAPRTSPDPGRYSIVMILSSFQNDEYVKRDYKVFPPVDIFREVKLISPSYSCREDSVSLCAERISHNFCNGTGALKLVLWACSKPILDRSWNGHRVAEAQLDKLKTGEVYNVVVRPVPLTRPPAGSYYMVMFRYMSSKSCFVSGSSDIEAICRKEQLHAE